MSQEATEKLQNSSTTFNATEGMKMVAKRRKIPEDNVSVSAVS
jgi:hypothetical protein